MFWDDEITPEIEEEMIEWAARQLYKYGMETAAILFIESYKPISRMGSSMGQLFFTPFLPFFGDEAIIKGDKFFRVFQEDKNVEKLIRRLEEIAAHGLEPSEKKEKRTEDKESELLAKEKTDKEKKGWRKYLPF